MTVYVDDMRLPAQVGRFHGRWSHLMADSTEELVAFADCLGLSRAWIQHLGTALEHFDVTDSKRRHAIKAGAVPIEYRREGAALTAAKLAGRTFDLAAVRASHTVVNRDGHG